MSAVKCNECVNCTKKDIEIRETKEALYQVQAQLAEKETEIKVLRLKIDQFKDERPQMEMDLGPKLLPLIDVDDVKMVKDVKVTTPPSTPPPSSPPPTPSHDLMRQLELGHAQQPKLYGDEFRCKGCNMRREFQSNLQLCRTHMLNKIDLSIRVNPEPTNAVDKNAIAFQVKIPGDDSWKTIGYVGVDKIPKVRAAYENNEITAIVMSIPKYGHSARIPGYFSTIDITKRNKWLPNDPNNVYLKP